MKVSERHYNHRKLLMSFSDTPPPLPDCNDFDRTLSVSLAVVVLFTLIIGLLCSVFHCYRRHPRQYPTQQDCATAVPPTNRGGELAAIPILIYGDSCCSSPPTTSFDSENCAICLAEFSRGEEVRVLPRCGHMYHKECIDLWLLTRSSYCPICRDRTIQTEVEPTSTNCNFSSLSVTRV
ncbi:RING-H2 finger protein [Quillaja saponaria]|uniref:RING-H2 finger protein n=1 Tax=Quillaja saponaria TaxID=32244 RepID=A0AAD7PEY2_QUISA|nr:RING-H2 finger protein [Quillaja saponaria]